MQKTIILPLVFLFSLLVVSPVVAVTNPAIGQNADKKASAQAELKAQKKQAQADFKAQREAAQKEFKAKKEAALLEFKGKRASASAEFKEKLALIKDATKKQVAQKLEEDLNAVNKRRTEHFSDRIDKFSNFLQRIISRKDKLKTAGNDVTTVESAITKAESALAAAEKAVVDQSGKSYTIQFTSENNLKSGAGSARLALRNDLKSVHDKIVAARKALVDALQALAAVKNNSDTATGSAETN